MIVGEGLLAQFEMITAEALARKSYVGTRYSSFGAMPAWLRRDFLDEGRAVVAALVESAPFQALLETLDQATAVLDDAKLVMQLGADARAIVALDLMIALRAAVAVVDGYLTPETEGA